MDELFDLADFLSMLGDKPSKRRWVNWLLWIFALVGVLLTLLVIVAQLVG